MDVVILVALYLYSVFLFYYEENNKFSITSSIISNFKTIKNILETKGRSESVSRYCWTANFIIFYYNSEKL